MTQQFFYLWSNHAGKTCFGITGNLNRRKRDYEGHTGQVVEFVATWRGPAHLIRDIEMRVKNDFREHLFRTSGGYYEWINEDVPLNDVIGWVDWEAKQTYQGLIVRCEI